MPGPSHISAVALVVPDYDVAIAFYTRALGFDLIEDTDLGHGKRWVLVAPPRSRETRLLLARAVTDAQQAAIGNQTSGRVGFFLHSHDFDADHARMLKAGVQFEETPVRKHTARSPSFRIRLAIAGI